MTYTILLGVGCFLLAISFSLPSKRGRDFRHAIPLAMLGIGIAGGLRAEDLGRVLVLAAMLVAFYLGVGLMRMVEWLGSRSSQRVSGP